MTPKQLKQFTGFTGELFVAYRLSAMGYHVALTRGGVPYVDILVGSSDGHNAVTFQVKTRNQAFSRATKSKKEPACWFWPIGAKAKEYRGKSAFYAFVDLNIGMGDPRSPMPTPDVFIVPADVVASSMCEAFPKNAKDERTTWCSIYEKRPKPPMYFFHIEADENRNEKKKKWQEAWELIESDISK